MTNLTSMMTEDEFLEHSGVKGMKWGITRDPKTGIRPIANTLDKSAFGRMSKANVDRHNNRQTAKTAKKLAKADDAWMKEQNTTAAYIKINNHVADKMNNGGIEKFNANPKYKAIKNFHDDSDPKVKEYFDDYAKVSATAWAESIKEVYGVESPSGRYKFTAQKTADGKDYLDIEDTSLAHADKVPTRLYLNVNPKTGIIMGIKSVDDIGEIKHNQKGNTMSNQMTGMMTEEDFISHTEIKEELTDEEFLQHYGKKGMKWGQRVADYNMGAIGKSRNLRKEGVAGRQTKEQRNGAIDAARGRVASGANKADFKAAKADYKASKHTEGKAAAKAALRAVRDKNADDAHDSQLSKSGAETVVAVVASVVGGIIIASLSR